MFKVVGIDNLNNKIFFNVLGYSEFILKFVQFSTNITRDDYVNIKKIRKLGWDNSRMNAEYSYFTKIKK